LLASEQGATTSLVTGLTLEQGTAGASLTGSVLGELGLVGFGSIGFVAQCNGLRVSVGDHGALGESGACEQSAAAQADLNNEFTAI
jgi:hypothetical protein